MINAILRDYIAYIHFFFLNICTDHDHRQQFPTRSTFLSTNQICEGHAWERRKLYPSVNSSHEDTVSEDAAKRWQRQASLNKTDEKYSKNMTVLFI